MMDKQQTGEVGVSQPTRRAFLRLCLALPAPIVLSACLGQSSTLATPQAGASPGATNVPTSQAAPTAAQQAPAQPAPTRPAPTQAPPTQAAPAQPPTQAPAAASAPPAASSAQVLPPTPECSDGSDDPTPAQTEGPYFTRNSPERASLLEPGMGGTRLILEGYVLSTSCQPVPRALLDFWQADDRGQYDNTGYRLRGHLFTDQSGQYRLETIMPGLYPGRTRHIHVKVQAPNQPVLTTQLYFPGEAANQRDGIFRPELVVQMQDVSTGKLARFDFVLSRV
jgi:protocatechuate 3,4-dioxygenase beta subunit